MRIFKLIIVGFTILSVLGCEKPKDQAPLKANPEKDTGKANTGALASSESFDEYYDIGEFHCRVSTQSESAQLWFDRGLAMCYAFNHEEARRCFQKAIRQDSGFSMGYAGMAYALGPNINNMEIPAEQIAQAQQLVQVAQWHAASNQDWENDWIDALARRYASPIPKMDDREKLNRPYSDSMRKLAKSYSENPMINVLFAESLMILRPWNHWTKDGKPAEETPEIVAVLESGLGKWPNDPGLCHFYIHTMEASPEPGRALEAANRLRTLMPGAGHLVHMPSHIDALVGDYKSVIESNARAIAVDREFVKREGKHNFYTLYRIHNYHFLVYGAMFDGQRELALRTARELVNQVPADMLKQQVDFIDAFIPTELHVMVRFGMWDEIIAYDQPAEFLPMTRSVWRYCRAIAYAAKGNVEFAEREQAAFQKARTKVPETSILFNNSCQNILGVAESMIAGEIEYRKGNFDQAFALLREAVRRDDGLNYDEPWGWMQPTRHALGALLLEQKEHELAAKVYREDLKRRPNNPWSLHGLAECLEKMGNNTEADKVKKQFQIASQRADISIDRSCFCKNGNIAK